jgi:LysM repeat protein
MAYKLLEQYSSVFVGPPMTPKGFAIHWWGDPATRPEFYGIVNLLINRGLQQSASVNFVAEAGIVACLVSPNRVAWAQGDGGSGWGNLNLVSIECNPRCTAADRETVAELIADQHIANGIPINLYPHKRFTSTQCPGVWEAWIPWLTTRANQIVAAKRGGGAPVIVPASTTPKPKPAPKPAPAPSGPLYWIVDPGDTLGAIAKACGVTVSAIAAVNRGINVNRILVGQKINLPKGAKWPKAAPKPAAGPTLWIVDPGDTMGGIAARSGVSLAALVRVNPGVNPDRIYPGQRLNLPAGAHW